MSPFPVVRLSRISGICYRFDKVLSFWWPVSLYFHRFLSGSARLWLNFQASNTIEPSLFCSRYSVNWIISSALCYSAAELQSSHRRPSSVVIHPSIVHRHHCLANRQMDWHQILVTATYPPYLQIIFFLNFNFWFFYDFFSVFFNIGPTREQILNDISSESTHQIHSQTTRHTPGKGLYQNFSKSCEILNFWFLPFCFSFSVTWDHMGVKFQRHLLWKYAPDLLLKIHVYS